MDIEIWMEMSSREWQRESERVIVESHTPHSAHRSHLALALSRVAWYCPVLYCSHVSHIKSLGVLTKAIVAPQLRYLVTQKRQFRTIVKYDQTIKCVCK